MEKEQLIKLTILVPEWKKLATLLVEKDEFQCELFKKTFEATYTLLKPFSVQTTVEKELMQLIIQMQNFISARPHGLGKDYSAAVVMTERLLFHCIVRPAAYVEPVIDATIYSIETHEDIRIDFTDVDAAMETLGAAIEKSAL